MADGPLFSFEGNAPQVAADAFVAPTAAVIGRVEIGPQSGVWFHCVLRGDTNFIRIGARSNIQDGTIIHVNAGTLPTIIGDDVTVGHGCIIHACTLKDRAFVGMGATVLDGATIEEGGMLAAGGLHVIHLDAAVFATVKPEQRHLQLAGAVQHRFRLNIGARGDDLAIPRHGRLQLGVMDGIHPRRAPTPAESGHGGPIGIALIRRRPGQQRIEIGHQRRIRRLVDEVAEDRAGVGGFADIPQPGVNLYRHREVARSGETAASVLDVFVHAEDFFVHQHDGEGAGAGWPAARAGSRRNSHSSGRP